MKWFLLIGTIFFLFFQYKLWFGQDSIQTVSWIKQQISTQDGMNQKLQNENTVLKEEIDELKKGQSMLEEKARSDLGLIKDGEVFYQIVDPAT